MCVCVHAKSSRVKPRENSNTKIPRRSKIWISRTAKFITIDYAHSYTHTYICIHGTYIYKRLYIYTYVCIFIHFFRGEFANFQSSRMFLRRVISATLSLGAWKTRNFTQGANLLSFHINDFGSIKIWNKLKIPQLAIFAVRGADWLTFHTLNGLLHLHTNKVCVCAHTYIDVFTNAYKHTYICIYMSGCHLSSSFSFGENKKGLELIVGVLMASNTATMYVRVRLCMYAYVWFSWNSTNIVCLAQFDFYMFIKYALCDAVQEN